MCYYSEIEKKNICASEAWFSDLWSLVFSASVYIHVLLTPPPLGNIQVMVIVWRLRGNIIRTAVRWIV